ncbi:MAG: hypothetical protein K0R28_2894 [Paenibacillus sp.]|nr:hypothetical protein [Paenibacillus sp.]
MYFEGLLPFCTFLIDKISIAGDGTGVFVKEYERSVPGSSVVTRTTMGNDPRSGFAARFRRWQERKMAVFILSLIGISIVNNGSANYNWIKAADVIQSLQSSFIDDMQVDLADIYADSDVKNRSFPLTRRRVGKMGVDCRK